MDQKNMKMGNIINLQLVQDDGLHGPEKYEN